MAQAERSIKPLRFGLRCENRHLKLLLSKLYHDHSARDL